MVRPSWLTSFILPRHFLLEAHVPHRQHLVHQQDLRLQVGGHGKGQAGAHAGGVAFQGGVDELVDLGKRHDLVELALDLLPAHAQDGAVQEDVLPAGELGVKAGAHLQQRPHPAVQFHPAGGGLGDPGQDLEQGALAGAVPADDPQDLPRLHLQVHIFQGPDDVIG